MRIVTYARVSTLGQESKGESLPNQERTFARAISANGWTRLRAYREAASAGTIEGRLEFRRMIDELAELRPHVIVVDTLDRFTRNLREGLELLEQLRGHHVGLLPLDWRRDRPIDVDDDRDWSDVVEEFTAAERERRRIRRRIQRAYDGRRERGATTTNRAPFGLRKVGDTLVVDPATAWIVHQAEMQLLGGASTRDVARWVRDVHPKAWRTRTGLVDAMVNASYVRAGLRTPERHAELATMVAGYRERYGFDAKHEHELTGIFACGFCGSLMHGRYSTTNADHIVVCEIERLGQRAHTFIVGYRRIGTAWRDILAHLALDDVKVARWAAAEEKNAPERKQLAAIAKLDQQAAALKKRRDVAFDMLSESDDALIEQAKRVLREVNLDERELETRRAVLLDAHAAPIARRRNVAEVRFYLDELTRVYDRIGTIQRNQLSRALCRHMGSHPKLVRDGALRSTLRIEWPEFGVVIPLTTPRSPRVHSA